MSFEISGSGRDPSLRIASSAKTAKFRGLNDYYFGAPYWNDSIAGPITLSKLVFRPLYEEPVELEGRRGAPKFFVSVLLGSSSCQGIS